MPPWGAIWVISDMRGQPFVGVRRRHYGTGNRQVGGRSRGRQRDLRGPCTLARPAGRGARCRHFFPPTSWPNATLPSRARTRPRSSAGRSRTRASTRIAIASAFQAEGTVVMHLATQIRPDIPILFLETGFQFAETLAFKEQLAESLGLNVVDLVGERTVAQQEAVDGPRLYERDPERCCEMNKVRPMFEALRGLDAWMTAFRRDSSPTRAAAPFVEQYELEPGRMIVKINPVAAWSRDDTWDYLRRATACRTTRSTTWGTPRSGARPVRGCASPVSRSAPADGPARRSGSAGSTWTRPPRRTCSGSRRRSGFRATTSVGRRWRVRPRPRAPRARARPRDAGAHRASPRRPARGTARGRDQHVRCVVDVVDVTAQDVTRRSEDLPRDPGNAAPRELADRQDVEPASERGLRRHAQPEPLVVRVRIGAADHHRQRRGRRAAVDREFEVRRAARVADQELPRHRPEGGAIELRLRLRELLVQPRHGGGVHARPAVHGEVPAVRASEVQLEGVVVERLADQDARRLHRLDRQAEALAKMLVAPPGRTPSAVSDPAMRVDHLVDRAVAGEDHHEVDPVVAPPGRRARRRDRAPWSP